MRFTTNPAVLALGLALAATACSGDDLTIVTNSLESGAVGQAYTAVLVAEGGGKDRTWSVSAGALPSGVRLQSSGMMDGIPREAGAFDFTATVLSDGESDSESFTLTIAEGASLSIDTPAALPNATVGVAYEATLVASGGTSQGYSWTLASGALPPGLTLAEDGTPTTLLAGTPTTDGDYQIAVRVTDSAGATADVTFSLTIETAPDALTITTVGLPDGVVQMPYSGTLAAANNTGAVTWSVSQGSLPDGLTLSSLDDTTAALAGTPTQDGTFTIEFSAVDTAGASATETFTFDVTLDVQPLRIVTESLPTGRVGQSYMANVMARNGTGRGYRWSIASGKLPDGVALQTEGTPAATLLGTPTEDGTFDLAIAVEDDAGNKTVGSFVIVVRDPEITILNTSMPDANVGVSYDVEFVTVGGDGGPYAYVLAGGMLPPGLSIDIAGAVEGTPTMIGTYTFVVAAADDKQNIGTAQLTIDVLDIVSIPNQTLPNAATGVAYDARLTAVGGTGGYTWQVASGALPNGITLSTDNGDARLQGSPTQDGSFTFDLTVTDSAGANATATFSILVNPALVIATTSLPDANAFDPYEEALVATGGAPGPITWIVSAGSLPSGLALVTDGTPTALIRGTPDNPGAFNFTIEVMDADGVTAQRAFTLNVTNDITIATQMLPGAVINQAYTTNVVPAGGSGSGYTWQLTSGNLPAGITLTSGSPEATFSGTPTSLGTSTFILRVMDSLGATADRDFRITVASETLLITTQTIPDGVLCADTNVAVVASGGTESGRRFSIASGALPPGLRIMPETGVIVGRATAPGTYTFEVRVTDDGGFSDTRTFTIDVPQAIVADRYAMLSGDLTVNNQNDVYIVDVCGDSPGTLVQISPTVAHAADAAPQSDLLAVSPDGSKAAFVGDFAVNGQNDLFVVDLTGAAPSAATVVNGTMVPGGNVSDFFWSPDSSRIAFIADKDIDDKQELYLVELTTIIPGTVTKISAPMVNTDTDVSPNDVWWSPNGDSIAYHADPTIDGVGEIFIVDVSDPTQLGAAVKAHANLGMTQNCTDDVVWAPDSSGVAFRCDLVVSGVFEPWFFNPTLNPPQQPTRVANQPFSIFADVVEDSLKFSSSTPTKLAYLSDRTYDGVDEIWYSTIDGLPGPTVRAIGGLSPTENTTRYIWSPDGHTLALRADLDTDGRFDLYIADTAVVPTTTVGVSVFTTGGGDVASSKVPGEAFEFSPDGNYLVFLADAAVSDERMLWSADLSMAVPPVLVESDPTMDGARDVMSFAISPDSQRIAYRGDVTVHDMFELKVVGIAGFDPLMPANVHPALSGDRDISDRYAWRLDGNAIFFIGDVRLEGINEVWFTRFDVTTHQPMTAQSLTPPINITSDVRGFVVNH